MKKVLLVGNIEGPFLFEKILELSKTPGMEFSCFDTEFCRLFNEGDFLVNDEKYFRLKRRATTRFKKRINILLSIPVLSWFILGGRYSAINICYISSFYVIFSSLFRPSKTKLFITIFGSDYTYAGEPAKIKLMKLFDKAACIVFTNESLLGEFNKYYKQKYEARLRVCRFGLPVLKFIDKYRLKNESFKKFFQVPINKKAVVCGTYGGANNNQLKILDELLKLNRGTIEQMHLILPYTYGGDAASLASLKNTLSGSPYTYTILTDFLSLEELAKLRLATDILIHLPDQDQFSGSMLETLYAGGKLITGSWLPYRLLDKEGAFYIKIDDFGELSAVISTLVPHLELTQPQREKNKDVIYKIGSWENQKKCWLELYSA